MEGLKKGFLNTQKAKTSSTASPSHHPPPLEPMRLDGQIAYNGNSSGDQKICSKCARTKEAAPTSPSTARRIAVAKRKQANMSSPLKTPPTNTVVSGSTLPSFASVMGPEAMSKLREEMSSPLNFSFSPPTVSGFTRPSPSFVNYPEAYRMTLVSRGPLCITTEDISSEPVRSGSLAMGCMPAPITCRICGNGILPGMMEYFEYTCGREPGAEVCTFKTHKQCLNDKYKSRNIALKDKTLWRGELCVTDDCKEKMLRVNLVQMNGARKIHIKADLPKKSKQAAQLVEHELKKADKKAQKAEKKKNQKNGKKTAGQEHSTTFNSTSTTTAVSPSEPDVANSEEIPQSPTASKESAAKRVTPEKPVISPLSGNVVHLEKKKDETEEKYAVQATVLPVKHKTRKQKQLLDIEIGRPYDQSPAYAYNVGFEEYDDRYVPESWESISEPAVEEKEHVLDNFPCEIDGKTTFPMPGTPEAVAYQREIARCIETVREDIVVNCPPFVAGKTEPLGKLLMVIEGCLPEGILDEAQMLYLKELFHSGSVMSVRNFIDELKYFNVGCHPEGWVFCKNEMGREIERIGAIPGPTPSQLKEMLTLEKVQPIQGNPLGSIGDKRSRLSQSQMSIFEDIWTPKKEESHAFDPFDGDVSTGFGHLSRLLSPIPTRDTLSSSELVADVVNMALSESKKEKEEETQKDQNTANDEFKLKKLNLAAGVAGDCSSVFNELVEKWTNGQTSPNVVSSALPELDTHFPFPSSPYPSFYQSPFRTPPPGLEHEPSARRDMASQAESSIPGHTQERIRQLEEEVRKLREEAIANAERREYGYREDVEMYRKRVEKLQQEAKERGGVVESYKREMREMAMRVDLQFATSRELQEERNALQHRETIRTLKIEQTQNLDLIKSNIYHIERIVAVLGAPDINATGQYDQLIAYFDRLRRCYSQSEETVRANLARLEEGRDDIAPMPPVPQLTQQVIALLEKGHEFAEHPLKDGIEKWLPETTNRMVEIARRAKVPAPHKAKIRCELARELQDQDYTSRFDFKLALRRIASRLRLPLPQEAAQNRQMPSVWTVPTSQPVNRRDDDDQCEVCFENMTADEELTTCRSCQQRHHRKCVRQWLRENGTCPHCRAHHILDEEFPAY